MSNIKFILFDALNTDCAQLYQRLDTICASVFKIRTDYLVVNYSGSPKMLFENLGEIISAKNILITTLNDSVDSYWGYMDKDLWEWLSRNNHN